MGAHGEGNFRLPGGGFRHGAHPLYLLPQQRGRAPRSGILDGTGLRGGGGASLAVVQYEKALDQSRYLYISEDKTEIEYRLAESYLKQGDRDSYEFRLQTMIDGELKRNRDIMEKEHLYISLLKEKGLDELLYLYRLDYTRSLRAFRELGTFYFKEGDYRSGVLYNLYAVMTFMSLGIEALIQSDPKFQFPRTWDDLMEYDPAWYYDDVEKALRRLDGNFSFLREKESRDLINREEQLSRALTRLEEAGEPYTYSAVGYVLDLFKQNRSLVAFREENNIYQSLYYLAASLYGEGFEERAREIWRILARDEEGRAWSLLAREQLVNPGLDKKSVLF